MNPFRMPALGRLIFGAVAGLIATYGCHKPSPPSTSQPTTRAVAGLMSIEEAMTCSPKSDPGVMRVSDAPLGQEILDETEATQP